MSKQEALSDAELNSLTAVIKKRYDIDFTNYESKSLKRGFARLIAKKKLGSILELWSKILNNKEFFLGCIDDLTVNLTELFRNPEIWTFFEQDLLPQYSTKLNIKMWHAGCSTGEEVYTAAIVLKQMNMLRRTNVLATDLSTTALSQAMSGTYSNMLLAKYTKTFSQYISNGNIENYFADKGAKIVVKDDLKKHIDFRQHNLVHDSMDRKFNIIFCRNVMIYFDESLKMKVLKLFHNSLEDNGYLVIGYYDMLPEESKGLFEVYDSKTRVYRKITP